VLHKSDGAYPDFGEGDAFNAFLHKSHILADFLTGIYLRLHQKKSSRKGGPFSDNKKDLT